VPRSIVPDIYKLAHSFGIHPGTARTYASSHPAAGYL